MARWRGSPTSPLRCQYVTEIVVNTIFLFLLLYTAGVVTDHLLKPKAEAASDGAIEESTITDLPSPEGQG